MLFCNFYNLDNTMDNKVRRMLCAVFAGMMLVLCLAAAPAGLVRAADASMLPMYRRAVDLPQGDLSRLAQVIRRAQDGEEITIGFLGGSITALPTYRTVMSRRCTNGGTIHFLRRGSM